MRKKSVHIFFDESDVKYIVEIASWLYKKNKIRRPTISAAVRYMVAMFIKYYIENIKLRER